VSHSGAHCLVVLATHNKPCFVPSQPNDLAERAPLRFGGLIFAPGTEMQSFDVRPKWGPRVIEWGRRATYLLDKLLLGTGGEHGLAPFGALHSGWAPPNGSVGGENWPEGKKNTIQLSALPFAFLSLAL